MRQSSDRYVHRLARSRICLGGEPVMAPISKHGARRDRGVRFEFLRMRPHDHMCWVFTGAREFATLAVPFLSEGAALGQRLMYVAENPDPEDMRPLGPAAPRTPCRSRASRRHPMHLS